MAEQQRDSPSVDDPAFWESRYQKGIPPWDLGEAPTVLRELAAQRVQPLDVICPGVGRGHDAVAWAARGHRVTAVDFAPSAVTAARALAEERGVTLEVVQADVFGLPQRMNESFDVAWEQTCLCALDPTRRADYAAVLHRVLRPGGELLALLWNHDIEGGPPWKITPELARELLAPHFETPTIEPVTTGTRTGEFLLRARRPAV